jgi:hypothetical protein
VVNPTLGSGFHLPDADHPIGREVEALSDDQMFAGRAQQGIAGRSLIGAMGEVSLLGPAPMDLGDDAPERAGSGIRC